MDNISIYVLNEDGSIRNQRIGNIDNIMFAVEAENLAYTLQQPPDYFKVWYWYDNQWNDKPSN